MAFFACGTICDVEAGDIILVGLSAKPPTGLTRGGAVGIMLGSVTPLKVDECLGRVMT